MKLDLEIDDHSGEIVGDVPEALKGIFTRIENTAHTAGFGKGNAKAAEEAKAQIASAVAEARRDMERDAPIRAERFTALEADHKAIQKRLLDQEQEHTRTLTSLGEKHARELLDRATAIKNRNEVIQGLVRDAVVADARAFGTKDDMLEVLSNFLLSQIGYDDDMKAYVKNADGTRKTVQGKDQSISAFVKEYIDTHATFRKPPAGQGGGARGGQSFHGHAATSVEAAAARLDAGDRSLGAIKDLVQAERAKRAG